VLLNTHEIENCRSYDNGSDEACMKMNRSNKYITMLRMTDPKYKIPDLLFSKNGRITKLHTYPAPGLQQKLCGAVSGGNHPSSPLVLRGTW
jgi:hypothetical protein